MDLGYDLIVTVTGVVLVFMILVLLMLIITLEGKIFDAMLNKKKPQAPAAKPAPAAPAQPKPAAAPVQPEAPQVEQGIPGDVVAAIAAAVYAMSNGKYTLRAVRRARHNSWGKAGINDTTAPF